MNENLWGFGPEKHLTVEDRLDILLKRLIDFEESHFQKLEQLEKFMSAVVDQLVANVQAEDTVIASAETLLSGLAAALDLAIQAAQAGDFNALTSLSQDVKQQTSGLAAAVATGQSAVAPKAASFKVSAPTGAVVGVASTVTAALVDANGNPVATSGDLVTFTDGTDGATATTDSTGTATASITFSVAGTSVVVNVSDASGLAGASSAFNVAAAPGP